jgi:hypothetical protein
MSYRFTLKDFRLDTGLDKIHKHDYKILESMSTFVKESSDVQAILCQPAIDMVIVDGMSLKKVHPLDQTEELCTAAVKQNGLALQFVINQTEKVVAAALDQNGDAWSFVENQSQYQTLAKKAFSRNTQYQSIMNKYGKKIQGCWDGRELKNLPPSARRDWKICLAAVIENPSNIDYVQTESDEFWGSIVLLYGFLIAKQKTQNHLHNMAAVMVNGFSLQYVDSKNHTPELYNISLKQNPMALKFIPSDLLTPELLEMAIRQNPLALMYVPNSLKTASLCRIAIVDSTMYSIPEAVFRELTQEVIYTMILEKLTGSRSDKIKQICTGAYTTAAKTRLLYCIL